MVMLIFIYPFPLSSLLTWYAFSPHFHIYQSHPSFKNLTKIHFFPADHLDYWSSSS